VVNIKRTNRNKESSSTRSSVAKIAEGHERALREFGTEDTTSANRVLGTKSRLSNRGKKRR